MRGLIGETRRLLRTHGAALLVIALVLLLPAELAAAYVEEDDADRGVLAFLALTFIGYPWVYGAVVARLSTRRRSPLEPYGQTADRIPALAAANLFTLLAITIGFVLLIVPGLLAGARLSAAVPLIVLERRGPIEALERSNNLVRGRTWPVVGAFVLVFLAAVIVAAPVFVIGFLSESPWALGVSSATVGGILYPPTAALAYTVYRQAQAA